MKNNQNSKTIICDFPKWFNTADKINLFFFSTSDVQIISNLILFYSFKCFKNIIYRSIRLAVMAIAYLSCVRPKRDFFNVIHPLNNMTQHKNGKFSCLFMLLCRRSHQFSIEPFQFGFYDGAISLRICTYTYLPFVVFLVFVSLTFVSFQQKKKPFIQSKVVMPREYFLAAVISNRVGSMNLCRNEK